MKKKKILHITNWYPNEDNPYEGIFVKEHIKSIDPYFENEIIHLKCERSRSLFKVKKESQSDQHTTYIFYSSLFKYHRLCVYTLFWMQVYLFAFKRKLKNVSKVHYHIAPNLCAYLKFLNSTFIKKRAIFVTEHYSAYRRNFGLKKGSKKLERTKKIFKNKFTLITVSKQLRKDIENFCGFNLDHLNPNVLCNVVNEELFNSKNLNKNVDLQFLMVAHWSSVKQPLPLIKAFAETKKGTRSKLVIIGEGEYLPAMKKMVKKYSIEKQVSFLGRQPKEVVAKEMKKSFVFLHSSAYETFSVVCAEALSCGCYLIVNDIPAIKEYLHTEDGVLIKDPEEWAEALNNLSIEQIDAFEKRAKKYQNVFSASTVGKKFKKIIEENS